MKPKRMQSNEHNRQQQQQRKKNGINFQFQLNKVNSNSKKTTKMNVCLCVDAARAHTRCALCMRSSRDESIVCLIGRSLSLFFARSFAVYTLSLFPCSGSVRFVVHGWFGWPLNCTHHNIATSNVAPVVLLPSAESMICRCLHYTTECQ